MKKEYHELIKTICRVDDWRKVTGPEREGALGVAIVISYLKGIRPTIEDMWRHLDVAPNELKDPFERLLVNGIFSQRYNLREDNVILNVGENHGKWIDSTESSRNAWCILAGIAGGLTGLRSD